MLAKRPVRCGNGSPIAHDRLQLLVGETDLLHVVEHFLGRHVERHGKQVPFANQIRVVLPETGEGVMDLSLVLSLRKPLFDLTENLLRADSGDARFNSVRKFADRLFGFISIADLDPADDIVELFLIQGLV